MSTGRLKVVRGLAYVALILTLLAIGAFVVYATTRYVERQMRGTKELDPGNAL